MPKDIDLLQLHAIRIGKPPSNAAPASAYRDPAQSARFESEKCGTCLYAVTNKKGAFCDKGMMYGVRCEWFRLEKK